MMAGKQTDKNKIEKPVSSTQETESREESPEVPPVSQGASESQSSANANLDDFDALLRLGSSEKDDYHVAMEISRFLEAKVNASDVGRDYRVLYLYDDRQSIDITFSDGVLNALSPDDSANMNILLILHSSGGQIEPAYMLSKLLKKSAKEMRFIVCIPRRAKSAATLLSLGADELHMGILGEIGPIDPQINGLPLLGFQDSMEFLAELSCKHPQSSEMFARYLGMSLSIHVLGYSQRVPESAAQYAERLLRNKSHFLPQNENPKSIARKLVYDYKDHGFVIDFEEAQQLLGSSFVKTDTPEIKLAQEIHRFLEKVNLVLGFTRQRYFRIVGDTRFGAFLRSA